jgi:hypothetical protein
MTRLQILLVGVLVAIALAVGAWISIDEYGDDRYQAGYDDAVAARAKADADAERKRTRENAGVADHQAASNATITEKTHEEIQPVRERIVTHRVYVGPALCGDRPAAPAEAQSAASSDEANPPGRLVRPDVERDIIALKLAVEEDLATGRACQAVLKDEGMAP